MSLSLSSKRFILYHPFIIQFLNILSRPGATNWILVFASSDLHQLLAVKLPLGRVFVQEPAQKKKLKCMDRMGMVYYALLCMDGWASCFLFIKIWQKKQSNIYIYINPEIFCLGFLPKKQRMPCANLPMNETTFPPTSRTWQWRSRSRAKASGQGLCETRRSTRRLQGTRWTFQQFTGGIVEHLLPAKHTNNLFHQNGGMKKTIFGPFTRSTFVSPIQLLFEAAKNFMYKKR